MSFVTEYDKEGAVLHTSDHEPGAKPSSMSIKKQWLHENKKRNYQIDDGHSWLEKLARMIQLHCSFSVSISDTVHIVKPNPLLLNICFSPPRA